MKLNEKIYQCHRKAGLSQEALAERIGVSRQAISKWETGRGYPSIDSLKALSGFFGVTIDELLSGEKLLTIAEEDVRQKERSIHDLLFGLLDLGSLLLLFLPLFADRAEGVIAAASLLSLTHASPWLKAAYVLLVAALAAAGALTLALKDVRLPFWERNRQKLSLGFSAAGLLLLIVSLQPYAAVLLFMFLVIKALMLLKWR